METILIISLLFNALTSWGYLAERDKATEAAQTAATARAAADQCTQGVERLQALADQRAREAEAARLQAAQQAAELDARADAELATPPAVPGDACSSAQARIDRWKAAPR
ncbi:hypothetical protein P3G55_24230 [Leptospira sp. 96542]|nr:hypothetical protein [Leptospira sp. 96542]